MTMSERETSLMAMSSNSEQDKIPRPSAIHSVSNKADDAIFMCTVHRNNLSSTALAKLTEVLQWQTTFSFFFFFFFFFFLVMDQASSESEIRAKNKYVDGKNRNSII